MLPIYRLLLLAIVFACVVYVSWLILGSITPANWKRRIRAIRGDVGAGPEDGFARLKVLALRVGALAGGAEDNALKQRLTQAGFRTSAAVATFMGVRVIVCMAFLLGAWLAIPNEANSNRALWVVLAATAGFYLPNLVLSRQIRQRQEELARGLPEALELMTIAMDAGLGLDAAMMRVTQRIGMQSPVLRLELETTWREAQAGMPRQVTLQNLATRTGVDDIGLLVALVNSADQLGVPIVGALHNYSAALRLKRQQRAEELAAKIPVKLLFPLAFLVLPVLLMVLVGPSALQIIRTLIASS